jgi:hypothetical protein
MALGSEAISDLTLNDDLSSAFSRPLAVYTIGARHAIHLFKTIAIVGAVGRGAKFRISPIESFAEGVSFCLAMGCG